MYCSPLNSIKGKLRTIECLNKKYSCIKALMINVVLDYLSFSKVN